MHDSNTTENSTPDNHTDGRTPSAAVRHVRKTMEVIRHRVPTSLAGRGRVVAVGAATVVAVGLAALGVSAGSDDPQVASTTAQAQGLSLGERADDASRADRSDRSGNVAPTTAPAPTTPAQAAAPQVASPAAAPPAAPTPAAPTTKAAPPPAPKPAWVSPMPGAETTSCFGSRWGVLHAGIDLAAPPGTPVQSVGAGTVIAAGWAYSGYGISVVVDHGNGFQTHYAHLSDTAVSVGARVGAGTVIGHEGSTGDSTGPHLHFEVHNGMWNQIEPASWMRDHGVNLGC